MKNTTIIKLACILFLCACEPQPQQQDLALIRIGVLPDESHERVHQKYEALMDYLSSTVGVKCKLVVPESYDNLLEMFINGDLELAYFGGNTFVQAYSKVGALPIVMRNIDKEFMSYIVTQEASQFNSINDLKGKRFSFGSRQSTSGHIMPRYFLAALFEIHPEDYFSDIVFSPNHNSTLLNVIEGNVEAGVANGLIVDKMMKTISEPNKLKIIWRSPPYPDYVWAANNKLPERQKIKIQKAFLELSHSNTSHREILDKLRANHYVSSSINDFKLLFEARKKVMSAGMNP
ncbi:MAG: phosphate/phosphite/phosphonate ABC transporter substrate-binding protein [Kangiellaceae bacterium]|nr:phosphate/phosphite/phosphonate ABC transporter substrate-binding protein [Kangiellaceae bacterium]MCW9017027.1 phosphate/phosphite/phosphonate ABC transporter substrate-binding protein [Kangiellaceae bacterium]